MEIDVIIPLYKPGKELFTLLDKLGSQSVPVHQVILLNTEEKYFEQLIYGIRFLETYQNIKIYHVSKREFDHGGTRRMGVKKSSADVFVMMTQDAMPKDDRLIEKLVEPLQGEVAVAYARQLPREDSTPVESYTREFNYPAKSRIKSAADLDSLGIKTFFCSNVCAAYRREIYEELGGFVRHTIFNEDMIYAAKAVEAGYSVAYAAEDVYKRQTQYTITMKGIDGARQIAEIMDKLRKNPPKAFGDLKVEKFRDYLNDVVIDMESGEKTTTGLPKSNVLYFELPDNAWCCARPSGTEPKIKFYMGVKGNSIEDAQAKVEKLTEDVKAVL